MEWEFGDELENGYASRDDPHRRGFFIRKGYRTGGPNPGPYAVLTDWQGNFWDVSLCDLEKVKR